MTDDYVYGLFVQVLRDWHEGDPTSQDAVGEEIAEIFYRFGFEEGRLEGEAPGLQGEVL